MHKLPRRAAEDGDATIGGHYGAARCHISPGSPVYGIGMSADRLPSAANRTSGADLGPPWLDRVADYPFESRYLEIEGNRVHYIDEGGGPTVLFLHANPLWSFHFRKVVKALRGQFRCIALDYPGYGLSRATSTYGFRVEDHARIVEAFVRALGITGATLFAHDAGGPIGLWVAGEHPSRFRALVLSDCFGWPLSEDPKVAGMLRFVSSRGFGVLITAFNFLPRVILAGGIKGAVLSRSEKDAYLGPFLAAHTRHVQSRLFRSYVDRGGEVFMRSVRGGLARLRDTPTLIVFGAGDPVTKLGFPEKLARLLPRHRIVLIDGQDHFPHDGAGAEIAHIVAHWWETDVAAAR